MAFFKKDEVLIRSKQNLSNPGKCIKLNIFSDVIKQQTPFHRINLKNQANKVPNCIPVHCEKNAV